MRIVGKIFIGIISTLLFITLVILATIRFEILNKSFLFGSFEKHNVYAKLPTLLATSLPNDPNFSKEEGIGLAEFAGNLSPQIIKPIIEDNLTQVIDYLNGQSRNVVISFSLNGIGFENASGIRWSLSQIPDKNLREQIKIANEIGNLLIIAILIVLGILLTLLVFSGKGIFLSGGIFIVIISLISKLFLLAIGTQLSNGREPSQKLLGLLSSTLFSDITTTWLVAGGLLVLLWIGLHTKSKIVLKSTK